MGNSDILLEDDQITAIRRLLITVGADDDPNIELKPDIAGLNLGGGDGRHSEGDLRLFDKQGNLRIHQTAGVGGKTPETTRAFIHGPSGDVKLGAKGIENADIQLKPDIAGLNLGGGDGDHSEGDIRMSDREDNVRIHYTAGGGSESPGTTRASIHGETGTLQLGAKGVENEDVAIRPKWAVLSLGGGDGSNSDGDIKLIDRGEKTRLHLDAGGGGPSDSSTNLYVDASTGSIHARPQPVSENAQHTYPLLYMFNSWSTEGQSWSDDGFPSERPVISHNENGPLTGLMWVDGKFIFQTYYDEDSGSGIGTMPPVLNRERRRILTVEMSEERVGINTDSPEHPLHVEGEAHATTHVDLSDARCKTSIEEIDGPDALETVENLRGVRFEWDENAPRVGAAEDGQHLGFLAQETEDILPEAISRDGDGYRSMATNAVTPVLVEATKTQQARIDSQESTIEEQQQTIEDQRERLADLETRITRLEESETSGDGGELNDTT